MTQLICLVLITHLNAFCRNVSSLAQAQAAPLIDDGISKFGGGDMCGHCGKSVFFAEQALGGNKVCRPLHILGNDFKIIFLFLNQKICCGYSKEPSHGDGSFEHPELNYV